MGMYEWMSKPFHGYMHIYGVVDGFMLNRWARGQMRL